MDHHIDSYKIMKFKRYTKNKDRIFKKTNIHTYLNTLTRYITMNPYHTRPYTYNALHALDYILHYMPYVTIPYNTIPYNTIPYTL